VAAMSDQDTYSLFPGETDGKPSWTSINVSWADKPDAKKTTWIHVRIPIKDAGPDGLPREDSRELLDAVEDAIIETLEDGLSARHVGAISHAGIRHVYFYAASDRKLADLLRPLAAQFPGMAPSAMSRVDAKQELYDEVLGPDAWQFEFLRNARVLAEMSMKGDGLEGTRTIEHFAIFALQTSAESFAAVVEEKGYAADDPAEAKHQGGTVWSVRFTQDVELDVFAISDATLELQQMAEDCQGEYDGWSAEARGGQ
jgi:regulator of RNase E activity RraB